MEIKGQVTTIKVNTQIKTPPKITGGVVTK